MTRIKRIVWITELALDTAIHKTSRVEILRHLAYRGYEVRLWGICSRKRCSIDDPTIGILCFPLRFAPLIQICFFSIILFLFLPIYVLVERPRFVIAEPGAPVLALMWKPLLSMFTRVRVILDIRSTPVELSGFRSNLKGLVFRISVLIAKKMFDGITTITIGMKRDVITEFNIDPELIGVWGDGVSTQLFDPALHFADGLQLRKENHLSTAFVVFYHGALTHKRGIIEAVRSIEMLRKDEYRDIVLFLLGNGPEATAIRALIGENGLEGRVILHDVVDYEEVPKYIAMSDVGLVPLPNIHDWRHQCPLNLLEYLAMGKPVIVTDIPANRSIVGESMSGTYVANAEPSEFARAMIFLHDRKNKLAQWGSGGRAIIEEKFDWAKQAERLDNFLMGC